MGQLAYASSKAAVEGLVLPMSRDLARYGTFRVPHLHFVDIDWLVISGKRSYRYQGSVFGSEFVLDEYGKEYFGQVRSTVPFLPSLPLTSPRLSFYSLIISRRKRNWSHPFAFDHRTELATHSSQQRSSLLVSVYLKSLLTSQRASSRMVTSTELVSFSALFESFVFSNEGKVSSIELELMDCDMWYVIAIRIDGGGRMAKM